MEKFRNLTTEIDSSNYLWVSLKQTDGERGLICTDLVNEMSALLDTANQTFSGMVFYAFSLRGVTDSEFTRQQNPSINQPLIRKTQQLCQQVENLNIPTVSLIEQNVDLELALATDYCIAKDSVALRLGFADVTQGSHSVLGGVQRAIRRMSVHTAMHLLLTGRQLSTKQALQYGLIDACVPETHLHKTARHWLNSKPTKKRHTNPLHTVSGVRSLTAPSIEKAARIRHSHEQTPAPYRIIQLWKQYGTRLDEQALQAYTESLIDLSNSSVYRNLKRVHQLKQRLQDPATPRSRPLHQVHIIGSSETAANIATHMLQQGLQVSLQDKQQEALLIALQAIRQNLEKEQLTPACIEQAMQRITPDQSGKGVETADLILLTGLHKLTVDQEIFAMLEEQAKPEALLATQSTIADLNAIAATLLKPERLIGLHFCFPEHKAPLVEISHIQQTSETVVQQAFAALHQINKLPLLVHNNPGLLIDRILSHYILHAIRLQQQGIPHTLIDQAARDFGMRDGPLELADKLGLDYCLRLAESMEKASGLEVPYQLISMIRTGKLGIKSGSGFYRYRNGGRLKPVRDNWDGDYEALKKKIITPIIEEAAFCLEEGVIDEPDTIDAGIIFGTGFAAFTGGPLFYKHSTTTKSGMTP